MRCAINIIQFSLLCSRDCFSIPNVFEGASNDEVLSLLSFSQLGFSPVLSCLTCSLSAVPHAWIIAVREASK